MGATQPVGKSSGVFYMENLDVLFFMFYSMLIPNSSGLLGMEKFVCCINMLYFIFFLNFL